jgi:outer membrane receptor protein involved in Fe transport
VLYANTDFVTPPLNGATGGGSSFGGIPSLYANFLYSPPNYNINDLDLFPMEVPGDHRMMWYRPGSDVPSARWMAAYFQESDVTERVFASNTLTYDFTDQMALSYRVGFDTYTQRQTRSFNKGVGGAYPVVNNGIFQTQVISNTIWNHDLIFSYNREINSDINMSARVGFNARNDFRQRDGAYSEGQVVFGLLHHSNFSTSSTRSSAFDGRVFYRIEEQQRYGAYADFQFDYKNYLFLNLAARNDWTSTLEEGNNSILYPSVSTSFVVTDAFTSLKSDALNFLKFRLGYGTSAGLGPLYGTRTVVASNPRGYIDASGTYSQHTISDRLGNRGLKPEEFSELELGFEAKFLNERIGIDFTVYNRTTTNLITDAPIDPATGYTVTYLNLGKLENKGIEIGLNATPLKVSGFQWDLTWNFTLVRPEVITLGAGIDQIVLAGFTNLGNFAVPGRPMNMIMGTVIARSPDGQKIVQADGFHETSPIIGELGNPNPDYVTTLINTFSWKGISLQVQFDYRKGGKMYGSTPSALLARGVLAPESVLNRDLAFITPGVKRVDLDGDGTLNGVNDGFVPNDILATTADYGFNLQFFARNDNAMYDATNIRMREISLSYQLPKSILSKTPIKSASVTLNGNNLWHVAFGTPAYVNWDPEVASLGVNQGAGFDYLTGPSMKRYGAVLRLTF